MRGRTYEREDNTHNMYADNFGYVGIEHRVWGKSFVGNEVTSESRETISTELKVPIQVLKITLSALER